MELVVRSVSAEQVRPLRMSVLRPGWEVVAADYDDLPQVHHLAAQEGAVVVGCATVFPSAYGEVADAWQLRGMAVVADRQGTGVGAAVLLGAIDVVRAAGAALLWANARTSALGFYERLGFDVVGDEFTHGALGLPHKVVVLGFRAV